MNPFCLDISPEEGGKKEWGGEKKKRGRKGNDLISTKNLGNACAFKDGKKREKKKGGGEGGKRKKKKKGGGGGRNG